MTEKYITYKHNGEYYDIPESLSAGYEEKFPDATIEMHDGEDVYDIPIQHKSGFLNKFPNATYAFDEQEEEKPSFWQKLGKHLTAAQDDSLGFVSGVDVTKEDEAPKVDNELADAVIKSNEKNKKEIDKTIEETDKAYYENKANEPEKSFWQKLAELPLRAQENEMIGDDAFSLEMKQENKEKGKNYTDALIAKNITEKTDKKIEQYEDPAKTFVGGVLQGAKDSIFDLDTWDQSIGLEESARVLEISKKLENGQSLTKGEQMIIDALVNDLASDVSMAAGFGRGYKAGKVTGESLPFMVETFLNPASGLGEAITKKFGKQILKKVSNKALGKAALYAARVGADVTGAALMSATTSQARVAADAMDRLTGEVDFNIDEDGGLTFNGFVGGEDSALKAYGKAFGSNTIDHFSEMVGNYFGPLGHRAGRWSKKQLAKAADAFGMKKIANNLRTMTPNGFGAAFNDFLEQTQWNGPIGEFAEEIVGGTLNALIIGDQELSKDDLFSKDNLIDTFLGVAIMGGVISGVKTLGYTTPETQYNRAIGDAKRGLEGHVSAEEMGLLEAFANNPFGTDYANLEPFFSKDRKKEDKEAVGRYLAAVAKKQGYEISRNAQLSGTQQGMQEMQKAFQLGQNMTEADLYDVNQAYAEAENDAFIQYIFNAGLDGTTAEELRNYSSYDLFRLSQSQDHNLSEDNRRVIRNLAIVKNAKEGLDSKLASMAQASISAHNLISTRSADKNGRITKGMVDGKIVYVKGDVKVENGSIVKPEGAAGYPVTVVDSMTGETMTVNSDEVGSVENLDVNEYNLDMADTINSAFNKRWSEWSETKSTKSKLNDVQKMVGAPIYLDVNGKLVEVEVNQILSNGEVLIKGKKGDLGGQSTIRVDVDSFYDSLARDEMGRPIYANQDNFRSQTANINAAQPSSENYVKKTGAETPQAPVTTEVAPTTEPTIEPTEPEIEDFNEMEVDILMNGVPVRVEVTNQDDVSGRITYRYTDANGDVKIGGSTIADFRQAVADAKAYNDSQPAPQTDTNADVTTTETSTETAPEVTTDNTSTEDVNLTPQAINWDELFEQDQESYFLEMQKQFGDKTERRLKAIITATQKKLDALNNVELETDNDILENDEKREKLEAKMAALNGMVQRLSAPAQTPEATEEAPETTVETEPVTDVAPETEPTAEEEVTTEEPVVETQPEPATETDVTTEPVNETPAPVAPNPVPNPIAAAKDREAKLLLLLNRNAVSDELKADAAKRAGKEVADMFATYEEYEDYEAEAADLGEFVDFFNEGVKESFENRKNQNNSGNSQGNSVTLEEPKTENNGEQTGQTEAPETAPRQGDNSVGGRANDGAKEGVDKTSEEGEQGQRESESENDKAKPLAYDYPARKGNATGKKLIDTFGFSTVTIPDSRKDILNTIYDFMMEMSKMLGISPKSIGQGGWLGVENLRGNSSSSATYQFSNKHDGTVVNPRLKLKYARLSSIAHEWWHSLDHVLSFFEDGKGNVLTTHINKNFFKGRKETYDAVEAIKRAIKKSGHWFRMENLNVPRSYKNYLTKYEEMAARAFDTYINDKFAEAGIVVEGSVYNNNPYQPTAEEMAVIAPAFDNLFKVLKEKEGKTAGTTVLYHIGEQMKEGSEAWRLATNAVIKKLIDSGINVIKATDAQTAEMLRIKEELSNPSLELMTAFHGSRYKFDKFDHSNMGKGEGAQAHGWGTYVAKDKQVGVDYAHTLRGTPKILRNGLDVTSNVRNSLGWAKTPLEVVATAIDWYGIDRGKAQIANELKIAESILESEPVIFSDKYQEKIDLYKNALSIINSGSWELKEAPTNLYTVEIPEDNGSNYFYEDGVTDSQMKKLLDICEKEGVDFVEVAVVASEFGEYKDGDRLYKALTQILGSQKATSELLSKAGFVGIKYDGRIDGECYVIFNEADAKITGHAEFYETEDGTVYGWTDGKNVYLTKAGMNPNTPVHEYTHLWARAMMQKNHKGWNSVKNLLKGTDIWNEVINDPNYKSIQNDEDAVASEALSRVSGAKNAAKLEQMAQKMLDEAKGTMRKAEARGLIQNIKDALNQFWSWVSKNLFEIENFGSVEEVTDRVLWDLMNETDLGELSEGQIEAQLSKHTVEKNLGGLWIADKQEYAKFVSAVNQYVFEDNGQGIAYTDDHFYAYYWSPFGKPIPYIDVYLNAFESQDVINQVNEEYGITGNQGVGVFIDRIVERARSIQNRRNDSVGSNESVSSSRRNDSVGSDIQRKGRYAYNPSLYVTSVRPDGRVTKLREVSSSAVINSTLYNRKKVKSEEITPKMDAEYLAAVEAGDMETAQKMVFEAAKLAMPNTKVVDENGNPKVVYHGSPYGGIKVFNHKDGKSTSGLKEFGTYFATNRNLAEMYRDNRKISKDIEQEVTDEIYRLRAIQESIANSREYDAIEREIQRLQDLLKGKVYPAFLNIENPKTFDAKGKDGWAGWHELKQDVGYDIKSGTEAIEAITGNNSAAIMSESYDGIIAENIADIHSTDDVSDLIGDVFLVWNASQIKSAEPVTYDNTGKVIPLSQRFNPTVEDYRYRKSNAQNAAVNYLAGDSRLAAIENAVNEEASKLGVKVTYKTREQMPEGHKNDKGYYDTKTGEIVVCTENASSIADAIQTILHESVAHKGLRQLMGDKFNEFINRVYNSLDAETKAKVDALATEHYDGNTAVATEEYMATLAESENFADNSVWDKIKSIFEDIINAILGRNDIKIGDNELRYILRASYNNMVNPRGMDTVRGWAQDQMMREEYKINQAETPEIMSRTGIDPEKAAKETASAVYDRVVNSKWNEFQRQFQDAYQPVRVAIDAIQQATGNIPIEDYENYLLMQNQSSSRSRVEIDNFERKYYTPIIEQVNAIIDRMLEARGANKNDKNERAAAYAELRQYLIAKHGLERNEYYQNNKTRKLTYNEKQRAIKEATDEYNAIVDSINSDTSLSDTEIELQLQEAKDAYDAALIEIETREVPDIRDYSGLTSLFGFEPKKFREAEEMAQKVVDTFEGSVDTSELWKKINAATDKTLRHSYESGMLSRQQYEDIKSMFNFYIPLRGFSEETAEDVYSYARFEGNRFNPAVYKAQGRTSVADDPIAIIMNMAESEIAQGNKNRAKQALYNYLLNRASGNMGQNSLMNVEDVWYYVSTDENGETVYTIAAPDHANGETYEAFENKMQALAEDGKAEKSKKGKVDIGKRFQKKQNEDSHYVYLKVNGVDKAIYINGDPKAAEAINARNNKQPNWFTDKMRSLNRALSSTFTNYSIGFTARNYFRDLIYARIAVDVKEKGAEYKLKFRKNWYVGNVAVMMKMLSDYRNGKYDNGNLSELQAAFVDFMNNGGQTGYTLINSVENHKAELERAIARMQTGVDKGGIKDIVVIGHLLKGVEFLNEAMELRTRFAAFKTSRDLGRGINTAINDAKEITVNFNTKGAQDGTGVWGGLASYFGWSKYFFNASVQGVQNLTAMAKKSPIKFGTVVCSITALGFMMPIIQAALYEAIGGDDDDYWNIPEYDRQNNLCIMIGGGKYVKMPLPIGFREMYAIGDMVAAMVFDKKFERDVEQIGLDMANKVASVVLPINPLESSANGLNIWASIGNTLAPSSAQFLIQNAMNVDWKGAPLQKEYTYNEDDPQWMKAFNNNPMWMKSLSKWCNENINLDGDYKGMDWSPEKLDNTLSNLGGGIYTVVKQFGQIISTAMDDEKKFSMSNVPLAGAVVGNGIDSDERFVTDAYFDMKDYYDGNLNYIKRVAKTFGYNEEDVFVKQKGKQNPKMAEIYQNDNFEFMKEWYKGNEKLEDVKNDIKKLEKEIASKKNPSDGRLRKLDRLNAEFETKRSEFVNKMLELE